MLPIKNLPFKSDSPFFLWKILSILVIGAMLSCVILSVYFIYTQIYRTLDDANTIVVLNSDLQMDTINMGAFEHAKSLVALKNSTSSFTKPVRNIFLRVPTSTPK